MSNMEALSARVIPSLGTYDSITGLYSTSQLPYYRLSMQERNSTSDDLSGQLRLRHTELSRVQYATRKSSTADAKPRLYPV
jgi:hypothetical protein